MNFCLSLYLDFSLTEDRVLVTAIYQYYNITLSNKRFHFLWYQSSAERPSKITYNPLDGSTLVSLF